MKKKLIFIYFFLLCNIQRINAFKRYPSFEEKKINLSSKLNSLKKIGRYYIKENSIYLAQSGSSIEFYIKAKSALLTLDGSNSYLHEDYEKPRYAIYLNDKKYLDEKINSKNTTILLFDYDNIKNIKIRITLLSEAIFGNIGVKDIYTVSYDNDEDIIKPTQKKKYLIEFIGDSITCGYGIEAKGANYLFDTNTENFEKTYAYVSSKILNYDYSTVCYSGCGIITPGSKMPQRYTQVNSYIGELEWDFNKEENKPNIIVINLGTNDKDFALSFRQDTYSEEYANFLKLVRKKNKNAIIICIYGMMGGHELFPFIVEGIKNSNDNKIYGFLFPEQKIEDGIGAQMHPNEISNEKWGNQLANIIKNLVDKN